MEPFYRTATLAFLAALLLPSAGSAQDAFLEQGGLIVIEPERYANLPGEWIVGNGQNATGEGYISWQGRQRLNAPGNGLMMYPVLIANPGTYRFQWRNQVGSGSNTTEHNDSWLKIEADSFYGQRGGSVVCPKGLDPAENDCTGGQPAGSGSDGWFKVYSSGADDWRFSTRTSDHDAHDIFARFDRPDLYFILVSARSSFHWIDRMVLSREDYPGDEQDLALPESERVTVGRVFLDGFEIAN